ncbi:hypothetical protein [Flammeovirga aprica]|uniref:Lipoprotein n=1 Tax=Flammeovirga aprica JL-4 TaxID=694437 RepID=A0A7X9XDE0_9BACT|nr:hypothetical protein [Flammeovirga aprica]NME72688.1 hypothetical protein [Flammeovirga aprica JL-4]
MKLHFSFLGLFIFLVSCSAENKNEQIEQTALLDLEKFINAHYDVVIHELNPEKKKEKYENTYLQLSEISDKKILNDERLVSLKSELLILLNKDKENINFLNSIPPLKNHKLSHTPFLLYKMISIERLYGTNSAIDSLEEFKKFNRLYSEDSIIYLVTKNNSNLEIHSENRYFNSEVMYYNGNGFYDFRPNNIVTEFKFFYFPKVDAFYKIKDLLKEQEIFSQGIVKASEFQKWNKGSYDTSTITDKGLVVIIKPKFAKGIRKIKECYELNKRSL